MVPIRIEFDPVIKSLNPVMKIGVIECKVVNSVFNVELWEEITKLIGELKVSESFEDIKNQPQIAATRHMYSLCGKDPSRYRPSAEALRRRIVKNQDLYQINTLVDIINLTSLRTGYSIGGFDASLIKGNIKGGLGKPDEIFHAIGRGILNIENLPIYRDSMGPIGSPTSDEERTAIRPETNHLLMVINAFDGPASLPAAMEFSANLLNRYAHSRIINYEMVNV